MTLHLSQQKYADTIPTASILVALLHMEAILLLLSG